MTSFRGFGSKFGCASALATTVLIVFLVSSCRVGYSFRGPGYDADRGVVHQDAQRQVFVAVTRGDLEAGSQSEFANELRAVMDSMSEHDGLVGYSVRKELFGSRVWTMSVWIDRASMERFVHSAAHRRAMASGTIARGSFITAAAVMNTSSTPPGWAEAGRMLESRARQE